MTIPLDSRATSADDNTLSSAVNESVDISHPTPVATVDQRHHDTIPLAATELLPDLLEERPLTHNVDRRPSFICATVLKATPRTDIGISVEKVDNSLKVGTIDPEGLFGSTSIRVGDLIVSINHSSCENRDETFVSKLIRRAKKEVTIVVRNPEGDPYVVSTMVTKPAPTSRVGIGFKVIDGCLCISSIDPSGLFAGGILNTGDKCVSIGDLSCTCMDSTSAVELIRKETSNVTIVTRTEQEAGVAVATVSACRPFLWRRPFIPVLLTVAILVVIALVVSLTGKGDEPECEDYGQRPIPYRNCD